MLVIWYLVTYQMYLQYACKEDYIFMKDILHGWYVQCNYTVPLDVTTLGDNANQDDEAVRSGNADSHECSWWSQF